MPEVSAGISWVEAELRTTAQKELSGPRFKRAEVEKPRCKRNKNQY